MHDSEPSPDTRIAVLVPLKSFRAAKGRLAEVLDEAERAELAERSARQVLAAAHDLDRYVVCDDGATADWAERHGASAIERDGRGLSGSVSDAVHHLGRVGYDRVIVAHGDLPLARDLRIVLGPAGVTLVPDRRRDGTNVCSVPTRCGFRFLYGPGSFSRHVVEAARVGLACRALDVADLAWDVDVPDDLDTPADLPSPMGSGGATPREAP